MFLGKDYVLNVVKEGYFFFFENFVLVEEGILEEFYELKIGLEWFVKVKEDVWLFKFVVLCNIFFKMGFVELLFILINEL